MPFEERQKIAFVEATLNGLLTLGVSPPKNASMFVSLFDGQVQGWSRTSVRVYCLTGALRRVYTLTSARIHLWTGHKR
jgi:hypothetical protein